MTHTIQPRSLAVFNEAGKNWDKKKQEVEEDLQQLLKIFDGLNNLRTELNTLGYILK